MPAHGTGPPEQLNHRHFAKPSWSIVCEYGIEQKQAIRSDFTLERFACRLLAGFDGVIDLEGLGVAFDPFGLAVLEEPIGCNGGQHVQRVSKGLPCATQAI